MKRVVVAEKGLLEEGWEGGKNVPQKNDHKSNRQKENQNFDYSFDLKRSVQQQRCLSLRSRQGKTTIYYVNMHVLKKGKPAVPKYDRSLFPIFMLLNPDIIHILIF